MTHLALHKRKRVPFALSALITGVSFAGLVATVLHTPRGQDEYLHAHLNLPPAISTAEWRGAEFDLPDLDKLAISEVIRKSENKISEADLRNILTGAALNDALGSRCPAKNARCRFSLRVNRQMLAKDLNKDFRVVNVEERSLRVDLESKTEITDVTLKGISEETRILRFYKTQSGWMQNSADVVSAAHSSFGSRKGMFNQKFNTKVTGLNYYPASASWRDFWERFPVAEIESDLENAQALNVNTLRIFLTHDYFDSVETREDAVEKLKHFLDICEKRDIKVLVTLFDLRPNYTLSNWSEDIAHIDGILAKLSYHPAILGIDLKNQPDLDFDHWGTGLVEAWLTTMARHIHLQYPELAVTTGWSEAANATRLMPVFDIITYHEYADPKGFRSRLERIAARVDGKPVLITELGSSVWHPPFIRRMGESAQASRLRRQLEQSDMAQGVFVWTLNDFEHVGKEVVGRLPWRQAQQRHFGLMRPDESFRPAARVLKEFGSLSADNQSTANHQNFN